VAVYVGYFAVPPIPAGHMIIAWGYYYILGSSRCSSSTRSGSRARGAGVEGWLRRPGIAGLAIAAGVLFAVWSDSFKHKILYDEFVIQGTAYEMHATKQVSTILRAYNIGGTWLPIDTFLDKRPYFFPFLVSLLHDLTGYRIANMFALNVACAGALLGSCTGSPARWPAGPGDPRRGAHGPMPLFGQNATGAGMDLHNLAMIALVACLASSTCGSPSDDRLSLFVLGAVLLTRAATSRSSSSGRSPSWSPRAGCAPAGPILPWPVVVAPLLLVPYAWHSRVLAATPIFWQLQEGQTSAFGWSNIAGNLRGDVDFLFNTGPRPGQLLVPLVLGLAGLAWLLF
jgi:hypothetical protein